MSPDLDEALALAKRALKIRNQTTNELARTVVSLVGEIQDLLSKLVMANNDLMSDKRFKNKKDD